jgi:outer membrane protein OmpA-like peptidoglycan-associated protein
MLDPDVEELMKYRILAVALTATAGAAGANNAAPPALGEVHFDFDSSALHDNAFANLENTATYASAHPSARIVLDAHCDPIGTAPYNVGLAIRRAETVRDKLTGMGVPADQIVFAIFGKNGALRATYADDRRVTVRATTEPLTDVIATTFTGQGTAVTWEMPLTTAQIDAAPLPVASR